MEDEIEDTHVDGGGGGGVCVLGMLDDFSLGAILGWGLCVIAILSSNSGNR